MISTPTIATGSLVLLVIFLIWRLVAARQEVSKLRALKERYKAEIDDKTNQILGLHNRIRDLDRPDVVHVDPVGRLTRRN